MICQSTAIVRPVDGSLQLRDLDTGSVVGFSRTRPTLDAIVTVPTARHNGRAKLSLESLYCMMKKVDPRILTATQAAGVAS